MDSTFKALFTQRTKESHDAPAEFGGQRGISYDILCEFDDGTAADIEMQAFNQQYDYGKRAEYQVARLETTYLKKGDDWEKAR